MLKNNKYNPPFLKHISYAIDVCEIWAINLKIKRQD